MAAAAAFVALLLVLAGGQRAWSQSDPDSLSADVRKPWFVKVTPYYWASKVSGARTLGLPSDRSLAGNYVVPVGTEELENDWALTIKAGHGRLAISGTLMSAAVSDVAAFALANAPEDTVDGHYDFSWRETGFAVHYRIGPDLAPWVEMYVGARTMHWIQELTDLEENPLGMWDEQWIDPAIGGTTNIGMGAGFSANATFEAAGFGIGSELTWVVSGGLDFRFVGPVTLTAKYYYKQVSYENGMDGPRRFVFRDGVAQGWLIGATVAFPGGTK